MPADMQTEIVAETVAASVAGKTQCTKDLTKTKLCSFGRTGFCKYGSDCIFAHSVTELRAAPNLKKTKLCEKFMAGGCDDENCGFAHGEEELRERPSFKKKECRWWSRGVCRNGDNCGFAHGREELRVDASAEAAAAKPPGLSLPPGLTLPEPEEPTMPDIEQFSSLTGQQTKAPLEDQVKVMSSVISGLQMKLVQLEGMMMHSQVAAMQQTILELSEQCGNIEASLGVKSRLNAKAMPFVPISEWGSDDSTSVGSD